MRRSEEIRARQASIRTNLDALETGEDTDETRLRADALLEEFDELVTELKPLEERESAIAAVRAAMTVEQNREDSETPPAVRNARTVDLQTRTHRNPFVDMESVMSGITPPQEIRSRATQVIEDYAKRNDNWGIPDDSAENATRLVERNGKAFGTAIARQMLSTGSPEYLQAFENYLQDPGGYASRAALSLTSANGGYLVPFTLDPTIILTNASSANPYRRMANVKTTTTNNWNGVTSAGVNAEWTAEGAEAADLSPTVGTLQITPQKADAYLFGSFEILSDSDFAAQLPDLLADAKDRIEETAFAVGTGSGQPKGIIPAGTSQNRSGTAAAGPAAQDVYALQAALPARFRGPRARNAWVGNLNVINSLRNVASFSGSYTSIVDDSGPEPRMLGKTFMESTSVVGVYTTGSKVLAYLDFSQFYIVDRVGMSVVYDPVVLGSNRRPSGQGAWYAFWRVGSDVSTATAVRVFATLT
jgi:HK97 family phage major capsid protein